MIRARLVGPMASDGMPYFPPVQRPRGELRMLPVPKIVETIALQEGGKQPVRLLNYHLRCGAGIYIGYHDLSAAVGCLTWHAEFYASTEADALPLTICHECGRLLQRHEIATEMPLVEREWPAEKSEAAPAGQAEPVRIENDARTYRVLRDTGVHWEERGVPQGGVFKVIFSALTHQARGHLSRLEVAGGIVEEQRGAA